MNNLLVILICMLSTTMFASALDGSWLKDDGNSIIIFKSDNTYQAAHIYDFDDTVLLEEGTYYIRGQELTITPNQLICEGSPTPIVRVNYKLEDDFNVLIYDFVMGDVSYPIVFNKVGAQEVREFRQAMAGKETAVCI